MGAGCGVALASVLSLTRTPRIQDVATVEPEPAASASITASKTASCATDAELCELCRRGDRAGYERLYHAHGGRMKSIAWNMLRNREDAEDAVQETFLKVQRGIQSYSGQSAFTTWIYRILVNTCTDYQRSRKRETEEPSESLTAQTPSPTLRLALERALSELNERQRKVFLLAEVEGMTHGEIAGILGVAVGTSKGLLFEARRTLRDLLDPNRGPVRRLA